jgi:hypothetical protein
LTNDVADYEDLDRVDCSSLFLVRIS